MGNQLSLKKSLDRFRGPKYLSSYFKNSSKTIQNYMCSEWHGEWCANFHGNVEKFFFDNFEA